MESETFDYFEPIKKPLPKPSETICESEVSEG